MGKLIKGKQGGEGNEVGHKEVKEEYSWSEGQAGFTRGDAQVRVCFREAESYNLLNC